MKGRIRRVARRWPQFAREPGGAIGLAIVVLILAVALLGPIFAPYSYSALVGPPAAPPGHGFLLGTDFLGRDVLSRLLYGGRSVILIAGGATVLAYVVGLSIGLVAGYVRGLADPILMRGVDILLAFPGLLLLLLAVAAIHSAVVAVIAGVVLVQAAAIARIMRTEVLGTVKRGFVEAAQLRGQRTASIMIKEILPITAPVMLADFGIRFSVSVILIASVNFLGLGLQPPAADWGLMISENRGIISLNLWAVLAPAIMLALFTIGLNLVADAYLRTFNLSRADEEIAPAVAIGSLPGPGSVG